MFEKVSQMCLIYDNKWRKYCALVTYMISRGIFFWEDDLQPSLVVEKKREGERRRVRLFFTLLRATIGLSIPGLGSNFSSLRRIITESFPRQAASSASQRLALLLLPPWCARRATDTRAHRSAERQWKMWCEEFASVINGPAPLPRPLFCDGVRGDTWIVWDFHIVPRQIVPEITLDAGIVRL